MTESFGMMEGAFFVGKNEILKWVNSTLKLNLTKIEQACTGAVYCQIIDSIHNGKVKMHKVNWKAKLEHEFIANFKVLQQSFIDCNIPKNIEVAKLTKGKYQDNLEFLQWMKRYYDQKNSIVDYDPIARRNNCDLEFGNENSSIMNKKRDLSKTQSNVSVLKSVKSEKNFGSNSSLNLKTIKKDIDVNKENKCEEIIKVKAVKDIDPEEVSKNEKDNCGIIFTYINLESEIVKKEDIGKLDVDTLNEANEKNKQQYQEKLDIANDEISKYKNEINTLKVSISEIGRERDFYFTKLRDFEMLVTKNPALEKEDLMKLMGNILYAEKEIELIFDENGNVSIKNY
jgi:hypothetical protein